MNRCHPVSLVKMALAPLAQAVSMNTGKLEDKLGGFLTALLAPLFLVALTAFIPLVILLVGFLVRRRVRPAAWVILGWLAVVSVVLAVLLVAVPEAQEHALYPHAMFLFVLHLLALLFLSAFMRMQNLWPVTRREIGSLFLSPIAWVVMTAFYVAFGVIFSYFLIRSQTATMAPTFYFLSLVMAFAIPMLTMRQIAEERRSGTIEMVSTAPVTDVELVLGKFLGAVVFFLIILVPTGVFVWVLFHFSSVGPDRWTLAAEYLGVVLMGMFMLSFGLFLSSISREQIVAAVIGAMALFLLWLLGFFLPENPPASLTSSFWATVQDALYRVGAFLGLPRHFDAFGRGLVDTTEVVFFLSFTAFFLFLAVATVSTRKWR